MKKLIIPIFILSLSSVFALDNNYYSAPAGDSHSQEQNIQNERIQKANEIQGKINFWNSEIEKVQADTYLPESQKNLLIQQYEHDIDYAQVRLEELK